MLDEISLSHTLQVSMTFSVWEDTWIVWCLTYPGGGRNHFNPKTIYQKKHMLLAAQTAHFVRAPSSQVGESCPPNALRPLPRPPTPASQYLSRNKTIHWLLSPSSLPSPTVSYRDCRVRMHSTECKIVHMRFGVEFNHNRF